MSLKDDIEMVLEDAYWIGSDAAKGRREDDSSVLIARGYTDRIIALVREALLNPELLDKMHDAIQSGMEWDDSVYPIPDVYSTAYEFVPFYVVEEQMQSALAAAGMTTAD